MQNLVKKLGTLPFARKAFLVFVFGACLLVLDVILNFTYYNPAVVVPLYGWLTHHRPIPLDELGNKPGQYPMVSIARITHGLFPGPRASAVGTVTAVVQSEDSDVHINLADGQGNVLVVEVAPEYPLAATHVGDYIRVWGVVRYDMEHRWWEIHPAFGWAPATR